MLKAVTDLFRDLKQSDAPGNQLSDRDLHLVSASLMTEVMVADGDAGETELAALEEILLQEFQLNRAEVDSLTESARHKVDRATDLFEFTDLVNRHFDQEAKFRLVEHLWQVARADGVVHKLEEATIRKVAELIYLPHSAFIRAKQNSR